MGRYRTIQTEFWGDPRIRVLSPDAKLLLLYYVTNAHGHYSGIYYIPAVLPSAETGLPAQDVNAGNTALESGGLLKRDTGNDIIWVVSMAKYQCRGSKQAMGIANHLKTLHGSMLIPEFLKYYSWLRIPYRYPIDGVSIGYRVAIGDDHTGTGTEKTLAVDTAGAPKTDKKPKIKTMPDSRVSEIKKIYADITLEKFGQPLPINHAADAVVIKRALGDGRSVDEIAAIIKWFVGTEKAQRIGATLSIALSAHTIGEYIKSRANTMTATQKSGNGVLAQLDAMGGAQ